jgi:hypothetical protein
MSSNKAQNTVHPNETHAAKTSSPPSNVSRPASQPHQSAPKSSPALKPVAQYQTTPKPAP